MKSLDFHDRRKGIRQWLPDHMYWAAAVSFSVILILLAVIAGGSGSTGAAEGAPDQAVMDQFDMMIGNAVSDALDGVLTLDKVYWLPDDAQAGPRPNPACAGTASSPAQMKEVLEDARERLDIQDLLFTTETPILEGSQIRYYLDDTIFSVSWKQGIDGSAYSFTEVKVGHPSQFRRALSGGKYGSGVLYTASQMAESVNAVAASSADFYGYRPQGCMVYNGRVQKVNGDYLDVCFVDREGNFLFSRAGSPEIRTVESVEAYVKEHDIRFSLTFGPILVENGELACPPVYPIGEVEKNFSRAAICQQGPLHYVTVMVNSEPHYTAMTTIPRFARELQKLGIRNAYALDGGQTATMISNGEIFNSISYGSERLISDILYFATAIPEKQ